MLEYAEELLNFEGPESLICWRERAAIAASASLFLLVFMLGMTRRRAGKSIYGRCVCVLERIADKGKGLAWYGRMREWLIRSGAAYHFGIRPDPLMYLLISIGLSLAGLVVLSTVHILYGLLAAVALFFLPWGLASYLNAKDNTGMLPELKHMYHSLEIQTRAGVYVTDALAELYGSVKQKRLRQALLDLAGDLVMRASLGEALERFQGKFDNRYIDSLCMILLQATESGQAVELFGDLSEQIKDMEAAVLRRKKEALDRSITFYQLGILAAIMGVVLYACVSQMFASAVGF